MNEQNPLSIIIPAYKGLKYLQANKEIWKQLTEIISPENIYLIEDSLEEEMKDFANNLKWNYFSKENGSKNSVLNFAIKNIDLKTKYVKVVDVDDKLDIEELNKMIIVMNNQQEYDFICAHKWNWYKNDELKKCILKKGEISIHGYWPSVKIFKKLPELPIMRCWEDQYFIYAIELLSKSYFIVDLYPYIYSVGNFDSLFNPKNFSHEYFDSIIMFSKLLQWNPMCESNKKDFLMPKYRSLHSLITAIHWDLRWHYEKSTNIESKKMITKAWKTINKKGYRFSIMRMFIWSKLYCFFRDKFIKNKV